MTGGDGGVVSVALYAVGSNPPKEGQIAGPSMHAAIVVSKASTAAATLRAAEPDPVGASSTSKLTLIDPSASPVIFTRDVSMFYSVATLALKEVSNATRSVLCGFSYASSQSAANVSSRANVRVGSGGGASHLDTSTPKITSKARP